MFVLINSDTNDLIIPLLEINNIHSKLIENNISLLNSINIFLEEHNMNKLNYNFIGTYTDTQINKGQINLINKVVD